MTKPLSFRKATEADLESLVNIHRFAFPDERGFQERIRKFRNNPLGSIDSLYIVQLDHQIVAHAFLFPLQLAIGGEWLPVAGIASVGVDPLFRGLGIAKQFIAYLHDIAISRGDCLAMLYPFRQEFYHKFNYINTPVYYKYTFAPSALTIQTNQSLSVRHVQSFDIPVIQQCYENHALQSNGSLRRSLSNWEMRLINENRINLVAQDSNSIVQGFASWSLTPRDINSIVHLKLHDFFWTTRQARQAILKILRAQKDQVHTIEWECSSKDCIGDWFLDPDRLSVGSAAHSSHVAGILQLGPMLCPLNLQKALVSRRYTLDGEFDLLIDTDPVRITINNGKATLGKPTEEPLLKITAQALTFVAFGGGNIDVVLDAGHCKGPDVLLEKTSKLFAIPSFYCADPF